MKTVDKMKMTKMYLNLFLVRNVSKAVALTAFMYLPLPVKFLFWTSNSLSFFFITINFRIQVKCYGVTANVKRPLDGSIYYKKHVQHAKKLLFLSVVKRAMVNICVVKKLLTAKM